MIDLLVGIAFLVLLAAVVPAALPRRHHYGPRINCTCNLKQVGLSFMQWGLDHQDRFPMEVSVANGGTKEFVNSGVVWVHFMVMSNELNTPKVLFCPADEGRRETAANTFGSATCQGQVPFTNDNNVSYFVGIDAVQTNTTMFLTGDRNLTNSANRNRRLVQFPTNQLAGWTHDLHGRMGNVGLADGSVQQLTTSRLRLALIETGVATNRLAMP